MLALQLTPNPLWFLQWTPETIVGIYVASSLQVECITVILLKLLLIHSFDTIALQWTPQL